jgi:gamma-glutamyl-gamma-aminobutyrate hydrolase PuuD
LTRPITIALSLRVVNAPNYNERRDAIAQDWIAWTDSLGALPLLVPNAVRDPAAYLNHFKPDLLVLTGGNDAVPGGHSTGDYDEQRNRCEHILLDTAFKKNTPTLAVCRGMHIANLHFSGQVRPKLPDGGSLHVASTHQVQLLEPLAGKYGKTAAMTNSFHRQGILPEDVASPLSALAVSTSDGVVEAFMHRSNPLIGIQWHPERPHSATALDSHLLRALLSTRDLWQ